MKFMKKKSCIKGLFICLAIVLVILLSSTLVLADIRTNKIEYNSKESVFVRSTSDPLCYSRPELIKLYVVEAKEWSQGDSLEDVRDEANEIPNARFTSEKIWENAPAGEYNLVVDCDDNEEYDLGEPIFEEGFKIVTKTGVGRAFEGEKTPPSYSWYYDPESPILEKVILQVRLSATDEDITLNELRIDANFPGANKVENLKVYVDENNNGKLEDSEMLIGALTFNEAGDIITIDHTVVDGEDSNLLFVYEMNEDSDNGYYGLDLIYIKGVGEDSEDDVNFLGFPVKSNILTVLDKKTCIGTPELEITPNPARKGVNIIAKVSNLTGCDDKSVVFKRNPCYYPGNGVGSCTILDGSCELNLIAIAGKYYACIDKDGDGSFIGYKEVISEDLTLQVIEETEEIEEEEETEEINEEIVQEDVDEITGNVIEGEQSENSDSVQETSSFMVLLEVTLLLILFVLVLILFKLGNLQNMRSLDSQTEEEGSVDELLKEEKKEDEESEDEEELKKKK
jgi:hypothetical protein